MTKKKKERTEEMYEAICSGLRSGPLVSMLCIARNPIFAERMTVAYMSKSLLLKTGAMNIENTYWSH